MHRLFRCLMLSSFRMQQRPDGVTGQKRLIASYLQSSGHTLAAHKDCVDLASLLRCCCHSSLFLRFSKSLLKYPFSECTMTKHQSRTWTYLCLHRAKGKKPTCVPMFRKCLMSWGLTNSYMKKEQLFIGSRGANLKSAIFLSSPAGMLWSKARSCVIIFSFQLL